MNADVKDVELFAEVLKSVAGKSYPRINGRALNKTAFEAMNIARGKVEKKFINRNKWTQRSIQFERVKGFDPKYQESKVGSTMDYMRLQEFGGSRGTKGGGPVAIPQDEVRTSKSFFKTVRRNQYIHKLGFVTGPHKRRGTKRSKMVAGMIVARKKKLALKYRDNVYKVNSIRITGTRSNRKVKANMKRLYHVGKKRVRIQRRPWLGPTVKEITPRMARLYAEEAEKVIGEDLRFLT